MVFRYSVKRHLRGAGFHAAIPFRWGRSAASMTQSAISWVRSKRLSAVLSEAVSGSLGNLVVNAG